MPSVAAAEIARMRESVFFEGPELGRRLSRFWILLVLAAIIAAAMSTLYSLTTLDVLARLLRPTVTGFEAAPENTMP